jgi:hypothetical protein
LRDLFGKESPMVPPEPEKPATKKKSTKKAPKKK